MKNLSLGLVALLISANVSFAQSGHTLNSVDTTPGTTAPIAPTDAVRPPGGPDNGAIRLPGTSTNELDKDAGSSNTDRKVYRKKAIPFEPKPKTIPSLNDTH